MSDNKVILNVGKTKIISDKNNTYFTDNKIITGTNIPTSGTFNTGDIVVNIGSTAATEPMWICNAGGEPGLWGPVGVSSGDGCSFIAVTDYITVDNAVNELSLEGFNLPISTNDKLFVHYNSTHLVEGLDYEIDYINKKNSKNN